MKNNLFVPDEQGKELHLLKCHTPFLSQAFKWFRDNHKLYHSINPLGYNMCLGSVGELGNLKPINSDTYGTYEEAELECLKELIKIVKK